MHILISCRVPLLASAFLLCAAVAFTAPFGRKADEAPTYTQPAENLLIIIADIQRHINDDVYRFAYATDPAGHNVFRAALVRLANYEARYPDRMTDVVALGKAQCFEKLCGFGEAGANYLIAQKSKDKNIRDTADAGYQRMTKFAGVAAEEPDQSNLASYEADMRKRIEGWAKLADELSNSVHKSLALLERERTQMQLAEFYVSMRFMRPYSTEDALKELKKNIDGNSDSKLLYAHHLRLADFQFELARDYVIRFDPEGVQFQLQKFVEFCNAARAEYHIVQQADGYSEKLEARAKMTALENFVERVSERAQ